MNIPSINPSLAGLRRNSLTIFIVVLGILAAYALSTYIVRDDMYTLTLIALGIAASVVVLIILTNWRTGLMIFLSWLLFEDLFRKYLGNNMAIYFGKDLLVVVCYLSFFRAIKGQKIRAFKPPFHVPLLVMIWFGAMQVFNPASPSIFYGLMGFKLFFLYVPLMLLGYALASSAEDLRRFFFLNLVLLLVIASLGVAQSVLGPTFLNPEVIQEDIRELSTLYRVSESGLRAYRPTSVFVSNGRFANFLDVSWLLTLGFTGYLLLRGRRGQLLAFVAVVSTAAALVLTTSRGAFMWGLINALVFSVAFMWGAPWRQREVIRVLRTIRQNTLGIIGAFVLLILLFPDALASRLSIYSKTLLPNSPGSELANRSWGYPIHEFLKAFTYDRWPYGYGIGTCGLGTQYVTRFLHVGPGGAGAESGFGAIVIMMGIVGLLFWLMMIAAIIFSAWRVVRQLKGSVWFPLAFVIFWFAFLLLVPFTFGGIVTYEDFLLNAYLWLLLGILFRLPHLALSEPIAGPAKEQFTGC